MILLHHEVEVEFPDGRPNEKHWMTLLEYGRINQNGKSTTAMALTVGVTVAIGALVCIIVTILTVSCTPLTVVICISSYLTTKSKKGVSLGHFNQRFMFQVKRRVFLLKTPKTNKISGLINFFCWFHSPGNAWEIWYKTEWESGAFMVNIVYYISLWHPWRCSIPWIHLCMLYNYI